MAITEGQKVTVRTPEGVTFLATVVSIQGADAHLVTLNGERDVRPVSDLQAAEDEPDPNAEADEIPDEEQDGEEGDVPQTSTVLPVNQANTKKTGKRPTIGTKKK